VTLDLLYSLVTLGISPDLIFNKNKYMHPLGDLWTHLNQN